MRENRVNDLSAKEWVKFTKSWFLHNPPRRRKEEFLHPAKYPEDMIEGFIRFFTKRGQLVFDPFLGTGSTLVACDSTKRKGVGIELQKKYADIAMRRTRQKIFCDDTRNLGGIWKKNKLAKIDFVITSPPYGPMLNKRGLAQEKREEKNLDTRYSQQLNDFGNIESYEQFVSSLADLFFSFKSLLRDKAYLVVILQNYRDGSVYRTLAQDFARVMSKEFTLKGERIWLQDNKTLFPYGFRYSFVPNVHHHYCLVFQNDKC